MWGAFLLPNAIAPKSFLFPEEDPELLVAEELSEEPGFAERLTIDCGIVLFLGLLNQDGFVFSMGFSKLCAVLPEPTRGWVCTCCCCEKVDVGCCCWSCCCGRLTLRLENLPCVLDPEPPNMEDISAEQKWLLYADNDCFRNSALDFPAN